MSSMSQAVTASVDDPEKHASSPTSARSSLTTPATAPKLRSCAVCRSRKVRCDKQSPCSNCRRANIACVVPSNDRPPRWARRLERLTNSTTASNAAAPQQDTDPGVAKVMGRLRTLENLVKELSGQLEQERAAARSGSSSKVNSPPDSTQDRDFADKSASSPAGNDASVHKQFGRLVLQDATNSRYVGTGFWSRVNDELDGLKMDTHGLAGDDSESSDDETSPGKTPSTQEIERSPSERNAFLFRHNLSPSAPDLREFHPLPSQIPFLLDVFTENINYFIQIVHMPTLNSILRDWRSSGMTRLTLPNEALLFSIYFATITSMEEQDVMSNFGSSKADLSLKYRLGLEHALAKADFLNAPDIVLVQAFGLFLALVRRHDSPRYVWMMTGLVIRMAQYLGLQRDGEHFEHLSPFEVETRRKVWWSMCVLDIRASEDQGTDVAITSEMFDTKMPLNINDADIDPETKQTPTEREGVTDMSLARVSFEMGVISRQLISPGGKDGEASLEDKSRLLEEICHKFERGYLQYVTDSGKIIHWVGHVIARLVMAKLTLLVFTPVLFSSPNEQLSDEIRSKLFVAAIEVAEYNHELNAEEACRQWRWIYQTYTHWYAIVYLLIEISRRPWSPIVERGWVALHSSWLIPAATATDKQRIWIPLRKLMAKARKHREAELDRLRADPQAAARLELDDQQIPLPSSSGPFPAGSSADIFRERWRQLVGASGAPVDFTETPRSSGADPPDASMHLNYTNQSTATYKPAYGTGDLNSNSTFESTYFDPRGQQVADQSLGSTSIGGLELATSTSIPSTLPFEQTAGPPYESYVLHDASSTLPPEWSDGRAMGPGFVPWLWADTTNPSVDVFSGLDVDSIDVDMDLDGDVNWYNWVESAKGMESGPS